MRHLLLEAAAEGGGLMASIISFGPLLLIIVVMYFLMIRPQRKREKEAQAMRSSLEVGDEIITIGGIIGTVVTTQDDYLVIESSADRSKIRITRWAIQTNNTPHTAAAKAEPEEK